MQGHAGSGKTTMLRTVKKLPGDRQVVGLAPPASAVHVMAGEADIPARTLQGFLTRYRDVGDGIASPENMEEARRALSGSVLVLDETSMVGTVQMRALTRIAVRTDMARLALIGDRRQLRAVEAGQPFGLLLVCRPYNVLLRRVRWLTPEEGAYVVAPLPVGTRGHFGAELRRFVLAQYHGAQTSVERLTRLLRDLGVDISKRQIMRLLNQGQDDFVAESQAVLRAGLEGAPWISVDDTGARHGDRNGVTTQIGNDAFAWFGTTFSKSRLNFLELLRAAHGNYVLNAAAFAYMHKRNLAGPVIARLAEAPGNGCKSRRFASEGAWMAHLEQLGITALNVHSEPVRIATEGALWGAIQAHGLLADTVILRDAAGQFNVGRHALCWVHAERLIHKLDAFTDHQRREKERIQARLWSLYAALKAYRRKPSKRPGGQLARRFDALFTIQTASSPWIGCWRVSTPTGSNCWSSSTARRCRSIPTVRKTTSAPWSPGENSPPAPARNPASRAATPSSG